MNIILRNNCCFPKCISALEVVVHVCILEQER